MLLSAVVTGAAPAWVGARLAGPQHPGTVVHSGSDAVYVRSHGDVIGVVSRHATALPCTVSTLLDTVGDLFDHGRLPRIGDEVSIGSGVIDFGGHQVRAGRFVDFAMPSFDPAGAAGMVHRLERVTGASSQPTELDDAVLSTLRRRPAEALLQTLGRGSGLTPFGDDVVCGMIATLLAGGDRCAAALAGRAVALAPERTTWLSTTLLRRAAHGEALPAFASVVVALDEHPDRIGPTIEHLLTIGHTSGAGMLLGLHLALEHITTRSRCP